MTEKENVLEVLKNTGRAEWLPILSDCCFFIKSSADEDRPLNNTDGFDWFGCYWLYDKAMNGYAQDFFSDRPLIVPDIEKWKDYVAFPDLEKIDWAAAAKRDLEGFNRDDRVLILKTESGVFERLHQLVGFEEAFIAMYEDPESFMELMDAIADFRIKFYDKLITYYKPDALFVMDDLGSARGPLMSPGIYRRLIKPYDKRVIDYIHQHNTFVIYHSCGCIQDFVGDIVDMGADVINPLQGGINDQVSVQENYGNRIGFAGALDNIIHLPDTPPEKLREEMRRVMSLFWEKKNLIVMTNSYAPGNADIMLDEARRFNSRYSKH